MAFAASGLKLIVSGVLDGPQLWVYSTTDAHTAVDATDYFTLGGKNYGMRAGDLVLVYDSATPTATLHVVSAVDSDGNATVTSATLA